MRAFYIFAAQHSCFYPDLKEPLFKNAAIITLLANPVHGYTLRECTAYDVCFRLHMCVSHNNCIRWTQIDKQARDESQILARDNTVAPVLMPVVQMRTRTPAATFAANLTTNGVRAQSGFQTFEQGLVRPFPGVPL